MLQEEVGTGSIFSMTLPLPGELAKSKFPPQAHQLAACPCIAVAGNACFQLSIYRTQISVSPWKNNTVFCYGVQQLWNPLSFRIVWVQI